MKLAVMPFCNGPRSEDFFATSFPTYSSNIGHMRFLNFGRKATLYCVGFKKNVDEGCIGFVYIVLGLNGRTAEEL